MARFKVHIVTFLLAGFLLPQGASAMHYFLVAHPVYKSSEFTFNKLNDFEYHSCNYHINGFSPLILRMEKLDTLRKEFKIKAVIKFCSLENYVHHPDYNFQLRGPPL